MADLWIRSQDRLVLTKVRNLKEVKKISKEELFKK